MKLATYNIQKGGSKRVHWARMVENFGVDLLLVQESYPHHEHLPPLVYPDDKAAAPGKRSGRTAGQRRLLPLRVGEGGPVPGFTGWAVGRKSPGRRGRSGGPTSLLAFSVHAPSRKKSYQKQVNELLDKIKKVTGGREVVIGGDFNLTVSHWPGPERPTGEHDVAIQARLAEEFGLLNCWQAANPDQPLPQSLPSAATGASPTTATASSSRRRGWTGCSPASCRPEASGTASATTTRSWRASSRDGRAARRRSQPDASRPSGPTPHRAACVRLDPAASFKGLESDDVFLEGSTARPNRTTANSVHRHVAG